jgi:acetoin utilization deacetylase AcuC-like enzyme
MKTFYRDEMNVDYLDSFSPSAGKPKQFVEYLKRRGIEMELIRDFLPMLEKDLAIAHDEGYVKDVLNLKVSNGFGDKSWKVAESLPYTTGSFFAAAEYAVKNRVNTFSPTSGFHHARYFRGGEFCTFNGLMIAALKLKASSLVNTLGIIDCDQHYGNGTDDIIRRKNATWIKHYSFGELGIEPKTSKPWLLDFENKLKGFSQCDVIFYHAGADPHLEDPLGGTLSTGQLEKRDEIVFKTFYEMKIPVVWNLAGGYQTPLQKVLDLHKTTYEIALHYTRRSNGT